MHEILSERAAELGRLAATIRSGVEVADSTIPAINDQLNQLAMLGITSHQVEGSSIYARPAGLSNDRDDEVCVFQAVLLMPGGIGAAVWKSEEYNEYAICGFGEQVDLRDKFLPYAKLLPGVRADRFPVFVPGLMRELGNIDAAPNLVPVGGSVSILGINLWGRTFGKELLPESSCLGLLLP